MGNETFHLHGNGRSECVLQKTKFLVLGFSCNNVGKLWRELGYISVTD